MAGVVLAAIVELLDILPDAVLLVDADGRIVYTNVAVRGLFGYAPGDLIGEPLSILLPQALRERHERMVRQFRADGAPTMMGSRPVLSGLHRSGRVFPVSISICNLELDVSSGAMPGGAGWSAAADRGARVSVAVVHDVSAMNTHLDRATALAETDALTGLGNRLRLSRRMHAMLTNDRPFAVLIVDLVLATPAGGPSGPHAGDEALRIVGRRLQSKVRGDDLVSRIDGDRFAVVLDGVDDPTRLQKLVYTIYGSVRRPLRARDGRWLPGLFVGGGIRPRHGDTEQGLLAAAEAALTEARLAGEAYRLAAG